MASDVTKIVTENPPARAQRGAGEGAGPSLDASYLMRLRLVVARVGEMDLARWWNTEGQLGALGTTVMKRGFPRTYRFAQARSTFAVAAHRCVEIYDAPGAVTLWNLPAEVEDEFELRWDRWIDQASDWEAFFSDVEVCTSNLQAELIRLGLVDQRHVDAAAKLKRSAASRAVLIPGEFTPDDDALALLALGFARGDEGSLAVPYQAAGATT